MDELIKIAGKKYLIGCVWQAILKSSMARNSGLKYLSKRLPKNVKEDNEDSDNNECIEENFHDELNYPNKKTLVLNAII